MYIRLIKIHSKLSPVFKIQNVKTYANEPTESAEFSGNLLRIDDLSGLDPDALAGPVEDIDGSFLLGSVVGGADRDVVESVQVDVTQRRDRQAETRLAHVTLQDVRRPVRSTSSLIVNVDASGLKLALRVGEVRVQRSTDDHVLEVVAVQVDHGHAVTEVSAQLRASDVEDVGQVGREHHHLSIGIFFNFFKFFKFF